METDCSNNQFIVIVQHVDAGGEKYAVLGADNVIYVMEETSLIIIIVLQLLLIQRSIPNSSYTNASWDGAFSHGTKLQ